MALSNQQTVDYPSFKLVITDLQGSSADIIKIAMLKIHSVITGVETPASRVDAEFFYSEIDDSEDELVDEVEGPLVEKASVAEDALTCPRTARGSSLGVDSWVEVAACV
ncbi:hypothetical protein Droror1_Dr00018345 [Drosera rotundifolia]